MSTDFDTPAQKGKGMRRFKGRLGGNGTKGGKQRKGRKSR